MTKKTSAQLLADYQAQIAELEKKSQELAESAKNEVIESIDKILEDSGFTLKDLYPELFPTSGKRQSTKVKIGDEQFEVSGKISIKVKEALQKIGKNPEDYDKKKVIEEFGL